MGVGVLEGLGGLVREAWYYAAIHTVNTTQGQQVVGRMAYDSSDLSVKEMAGNFSAGGCHVERPRSDWVRRNL